jgi:hypothetical protein
MAFTKAKESWAHPCSSKQAVKVHQSLLFPSFKDLSHAKRTLSSAGLVEQAVECVP